MTLGRKILPLLFSCSFAITYSTEGAATTTVPIYLLEALAPRDTTSSESFRKEFNSTVEVSQRLINEQISKCGYTIDSKIVLYSASDNLQAFELAADAEKKGVWLIVGPRRTNHYMLLAKGAPHTPSVSIMASSNEIDALGSLHLSIYPLNKQLAKVAAKITLETSKPAKRTYFSVVSDDCANCKDFSKFYDKEAKELGLNKIGETTVIGDNPDPSPVLESISKVKPDFVVLPNYSKVSAILIGAIRKVMPQVVFIGGDGWGDQRFGFIERNPHVKFSDGYTVRGFPPANQGLKQFSLGQKAIRSNTENKFVPSSGPGLAIMRIFQGLADLLCNTRPSSTATFKESFSLNGKRYFSTPWGVSVYRLRDGEISFWKSTPLK